MNYLLTIISLSLFISGSFSQKGSKLTPDSYVKWCSSPDFLWKNKDTMGGIMYSVRFIPKQYDIAKCALNHCEKKEVLMDDLKTIGGSYGFMLELSCEQFSKDIFSFPSKTGMNTNDRKLYLNNYIKGDLVGISSSNDTIKCTSAIYEASMPTRVRVLFDLEATNKPITKIVFRDRMINNRFIEFSIPELTHKQIPTLNLKKYE
ncbi:hypothetical protein [Fluviicola taffensis]|uniref:hypothetical protein n=1 Tax=Fluviicola taffensis TaxID=191579 RepID=UPI003137731D